MNFLSDILPDNRFRDKDNEVKFGKLPIHSDILPVNHKSDKSINIPPVPSLKLSFKTFLSSSSCFSMIWRIVFLYHRFLKDI